ncbi:hypothetical protein ACHQM5_021467 [Ranunculus cassubicifolius]
MMTTSDVLDNTGNPIKDSGDSYRDASPLAMGAGHINPNMALEPGLVYDASTDDYVSLLCSLNYTMKQIQHISRTSSFKCLSKSSDLNYPSFIAFFNNDNTSSAVNNVQKFRRTVTNVGDGLSTYTVKLAPMMGFKLTVKPHTLNFTKKNQKQSYILTMEGPQLMKDDVAHGSLTWVDTGRKYVVRSPIV